MRSKQRDAGLGGVRSTRNRIHSCCRDRECKEYKPNPIGKLTRFFFRSLRSLALARFLASLFLLLASSASAWAA